MCGCFRWMDAELTNTAKTDKSNQLRESYRIRQKYATKRSRLLYLNIGSGVKNNLSLRCDWFGVTQHSRARVAVRDAVMTGKPFSTETKMLSFWRNFNHWLHWKLSFWQLPVQPVMKISSKWRHSRFSVILIVHCEGSKSKSKKILFIVGTL